MILGVLVHVQDVGEIYRRGDIFVTLVLPSLFLRGYFVLIYFMSGRLHRRGVDL